MKQFLRTVEQYVVPALLITTGVGAVIFYSSAKGLETQPSEMLIGGLCLFFAGVMMTPFFNQFLKRGLSLVLGLFLLIGALTLGYKVYDVIASKNDHQTFKTLADANTVQRLKDLRLAQEQHKLYENVYAKSFEELLTFIKKPVIPVPYRNGNVMENKFFQSNPEEMKRRDEYIISKSQLSELELTEEQAIKNNYEVRDTTYISVASKFFSDEMRARKKISPVKIEELPFNPHSGERFRFDYEEQTLSEDAPEDRVADVYIKITDPTPFPVDQEDRVKKDTLSFGSLDALNLDGNWRE